MPLYILLGNINFTVNILHYFTVASSVLMAFFNYNIPIILYINLFYFPLSYYLLSLAGPSFSLLASVPNKLTYPIYFLHL